MTTHDQVENLLLKIAYSLVDQPEGVTVQSGEERGGTLLKLKVASSDIGKIIGRQGRTALDTDNPCGCQHEAQPQDISGHLARMKR
jgi:hypothetical protein